MSPTGSGKPLFDLIPKARQPDEIGSAPPEHTDHHGQRPAHDDADHRRAATGRLVIPVTWLYIASAGAILVLVLAYRVGYGVGASAERAEVNKLASRDADRVFVDPLVAETDQGKAPRLGTPDGRATPQARGETSGGAILTASGMLAKDPRIEGSNYLELATLTRVQAGEAVRYLATVEAEAIAVPASGVDRRGAGSNTSDRYRVIALGLAVPGDQYSSSAAERRRFERRIADLGKAWAEQGGASDFSDPLWRRFGG